MTIVYNSLEEVPEKYKQIVLDTVTELGGEFHWATHHDNLINIYTMFDENKGWAKMVQVD